MLLPKRVKYRRVHRGRLKGKAMRGNFVSNGEFGLQATEPCWITSNQIEAARIAMTRYTARVLGSGRQARPRTVRNRWRFRRGRPRGPASGKPQAAVQDQVRCP